MTAPPPVFFVSVFDLKPENKDSDCELEVFTDKPVYYPGDTINATIRMNVLSTMVDIRSISWQFYGSENLDRSGGCLSRYGVVNQTEYLVGSEETSKTETGPNVADKTHILEQGPFEWEVQCVIPEKIPPTFRTESARIEYYFSTLISRKLNNNLEYKIIIPIGCDFAGDSDLTEIVQGTQTGVLPTTGLFSRFFTGSTENKVTIKLETNRYQYCPFGMENPSVSVHLTITSECTEKISELNCCFHRKTVLHHKDQDINESVIICQPTVPLIPPLEPGKTYEIFFFFFNFTS